MSLSVAGQGSDLLLRMRIGGAPSVGGAEAVIYLFKLDIDGDGSEDYWVDLENRSDGSFYPVLFALDGSVDLEDEDFPGSGVVDGRSVFVRVRLTAIGSPGRVGVRGLVQYSVDFGEQSEDEVPDSTRGWLEVAWRTA